MPKRHPADSVHPESRDAWRAWLAEHHGLAKGVWLVIWKQATGRCALGYDAAVEEALCFGWVDSKPQKLDAERSMRYFSPRKAGSGWAATNKERVRRLAEQGLMAPAGAAKVEAAKRDGSWSKLDVVDALEVPPDLARALAAQPKATEHFDAFPRSVKRSILEWISNAKKSETRARRIEETARLAEVNERANQWRG